MQKHQIKSQTQKVSSELLNLLISDSFLIPEEYFSPRFKISKSKSDQIKINNNPQILPEKLDIQLKSLQLAFNAAKDKFEAIFLKIDNTAPIDMSNWVNELKCTHFEDVLLTLKYSQLLNRHIRQTNTETFNIVFRKWYSFNPALEFRCIFLTGKLKGICQRKISCFYHFMPNFGSDIIVPKIKEFCLKMDLPTHDFILDLYLNSAPLYKVTIVDFQKFETEKLLLFEDFNFENFEGDVQFKCILSEAEVSLQVFEQDYPLVF